jgi:hypothetical protein
MFRPPSIFDAGRKVSELRRLLDEAGQPISTDAARRISARAWGWSSWSELVAVLEAPGTPSIFDEDLTGPEVRRGVMYRYHLIVVTRRSARAHAHVQIALGLSLRMAMALCARVRFCGRHEPDAETQERLWAYFKLKNRSATTDKALAARTWLNPEQFRESVRAASKPLDAGWQVIADDLAAACRPRPFVPLLPGQRPIGLLPR